VHGEKTIGEYPDLVDSLLGVKIAAAAANCKAGFLEKKKAEAIERAAQGLIKHRPAGQFPVHRLHGGGGTSANMNANEVVANAAEERLGGKRGEYRIIHPLDHVHLHQSTNDVYPTACHMAVIRRWSALEPLWLDLERAFREKGAPWRNQKRIGRTCLQDAVDMTFQDLFGGYAGLIKRCRERVRRAVNELYAVNLGGTIIGKKSGVPRTYFERVMPELRRAAQDEKYTRSRNLFDAAQNADDLVAVSSSLSLLARGLIKIAKDFRLLSSGPEAGLGEIRLPAVQPGSTGMPGKVNPVIPEFVIQLCCQAIGRNAACEMALDHGELDLNIWESLIVFNILDALEDLATAASTFEHKCLKNLTLDPDKNNRNAETIIPQLTRLKEKYGYSKIDEVCREAHGDFGKIRKLLKEKY
jgi:aspartate ammonia-lyase